MLLRGLSHALLLYSALGAAEIHKALDCLRKDGTLEACYQPVDPVTAVVPGSSYVASIKCNDCPYAQLAGGGYRVVKTDQILVGSLHMPLSVDSETLY